MRKEPIVFVLAAALFGWNLNSLTGDAGGGNERSRSRKGGLEFEALPVPSLDAALPEAGREARFERNLFEPPSPTQPLPPIGPEVPPLPPLDALAPPTAFGPAPAHHGRLLRQPADLRIEVDPALISADADALDLTDAGFGGAAGDGEIDVTAAETELPTDPTERKERIDAFKRQYDWVRVGKIRFGRIVSDRRFDLAFETSPAMGFVQVDPFTGEPSYGDSVLEFKEGQVEEFGLIQNALTEVEVGLRGFSDPLLPTEFDAAVAFAERCLELRNETPRALEVAEELFRRAQAINTQDSIRPRLGLARCYELGFDLQRAHDTYEELLAGGFENEALVHARLGSLEATLRMDGSARERFETATRLGRADWEVHRRHGAFLESRSEWDAAVEAYRAAVEQEPRGVAGAEVRSELRTACASALFMAGDIDGARAMFQRAISVDPGAEFATTAVAQAGLLSASLLSGADGADAGIAGGTADGFEQAMAAGLAAMAAGRGDDAARLLRSAVEFRPFRVHEPLRALSRLAEMAGAPEDAEAFARQALEANPRDPWTLFQLARLAAAGGDSARAESALRAALDLELDLGPALETMAVLLQNRGEARSAERYFQRACAVEPGRHGTWSRRGWNALAMGDTSLAKDCFDRALELKGSSSAARAGLAWWSYSAGDTPEALTRFAMIVDDERSAGEVSPFTAFAEAQAARIMDHEAKEVFRDRFDRANGRVGNGWTEDKGVGPLSELMDGAVLISGQQTSGGRTRVYRALPPDRLVAFSAELVVGEDSRGVRSGVFLSQERGRGQVRAEIALCRNRDGEIEVRVKEKSTDDDAAYRVVPGPRWPVGEPVRVTIERVGEDIDTVFNLYVDGEPVALDIRAQQMMTSGNPLKFGAYTEGEPGRVAELRMDDVRVVRKKAR